MLNLFEIGRLLCAVRQPKLLQADLRAVKRGDEQIVAPGPGADNRVVRERAPVGLDQSAGSQELAHRRVRSQLGRVLQGEVDHVT